jgi:hypothetical protein
MININKYKKKKYKKTPMDIIKQRYPETTFGGMDLKKIKGWERYFDDDLFFLYKNVVTLPTGCIFGELGLNTG